MHSTDVFICGAGPAGLAAAIACRLRGLEVLVADCGHPPIDKACGEGLLPDALAALSALGVSIDPNHSGAFTGICFVEGPLSFAARFASGTARGVRRTYLHDLLHARATALGTGLLWNTQVRALDQQHNTIAIQTTAGAIQTRWLIGADGLNSRIRLWSGLDKGSRVTRRIGLRTHLDVAPWSDSVEVHWADAGQAYITPIGRDCIGLAIIARDRGTVRSVDEALPHFPALAARLRNAKRITPERGAATLTRSLPQVAVGRIALIGDASGSVDAVTGEGLGAAFQQAPALASAIRAQDLSHYGTAHREICRRSLLMSRALLLLDRYPALRRVCFASFSRQPELFAHMLAVHTGEAPLGLFGRTGAVTLGLQLLRG